MTRSITITSKTRKGDKALEQHIEGQKKLSFKDRILFKTSGYRHEVVSTISPICIRITSSLKPFSTDQFMAAISTNIEETLKVNRAKKDVDYEIEIK